MAHVFEFQSEKFWRGQMFCPKGNHSYHVTLQMDVALKYIGKHANCDLHRGRWYELTANQFNHFIHLERNEAGELYIAMEHHGDKNPR